MTTGKDSERLTNMTVSDNVIDDVASLIYTRMKATRTRIRVAIDGRDGAGKSTFADRVAIALRATGAEVYRASIDDFQNSSSIRYARGPESPLGYYYDGFDLDGVKRELLEPIAPGGSGVCRLASFDVVSDREVPARSLTAGLTAVLIFDGVFLHRPELSNCWEISVYLRVDVNVALERGIARDVARSHEVAQERLLYERRYVPGQAIYHEAVNPELIADVVIDNNDVAHPYFVRI